MFMRNCDGEPLDKKDHRKHETAIYAGPALKRRTNRSRAEHGLVWTGRQNLSIEACGVDFEFLFSQHACYGFSSLFFHSQASTCSNNSSKSLYANLSSVQPFGDLFEKSQELR